MDACRRIRLVRLAMGLAHPVALIGGAAAQEPPHEVIELRIENRAVVMPADALRVSKGDVIELRWMSDEEVDLHLHGYDLEARVSVGVPTVMIFEAHATGRFPITSHGWGEDGHGHDALAYVEVYPR